MARTETPICEFGKPCPDFTLPGVDGKDWTRDECRGPNGLLVIFMCNHCPYVKAVLDRIIRDAKELQKFGIGCVAISANDAEKYPDDSFENMQQLAQEKKFPFPYLYDESQEVAKAFDAVCTPDFFGYNAHLELQYRGRIDESGKEPASDARRDLFEAMKKIAITGNGPQDQIASMGCSIKWKEQEPEASQAG
ncbi:MAG: thioredoxin family protein [Methylohalobius sp. ZOD2]|nr:thioredoxin family protein [Methylothermaceae bacterium]